MRLDVFDVTNFITAREHICYLGIDSLRDVGIPSISYSNKMIKMILEIYIVLFLGNETRHGLGRGLKVQIGKIKPRKRLIIWGQH